MVKHDGNRRHPAKRGRGAATMEFALILPIFLVLIMGMLEFARAANIKQIVVNAGREGARLAVLPTNPQTEEADVEAVMRAYLQSNNINDENCELSWEGVEADTGDPVETTVSCPFTLFFFSRVIQLVGGSIGDGSLTLESTSTMRHE